MSFREQGSVCHSEKRSDEESRFGSLITKTFSPQWSQRSARRQEGQKFVRREMKRQGPVCHSESRSDEESRSGFLITKTLSPQRSQRSARRQEGQKFVRREMKRQGPGCHSESRSDEESRSGTLRAKRPLHHSQGTSLNHLGRLRSALAGAPPA